jgi:hypothetical protein
MFAAGAEAVEVAVGGCRISRRKFSGAKRGEGAAAVRLVANGGRDREGLLGGSSCRVEIASAAVEEGLGVKRQARVGVVIT